MSATEKLRILCYDVSCDKRRRRIARKLEDEATRVQLSVFEARLSRARLERLTSEIQDLLENGDSLRVYSVGRTGERHCRVYGSGVPIEKDVGYWLL